MSAYGVITPLTQPGVYAAAYAFVRQFGLPALAEGNIIRGWQNRGTLPPETNDYCVITVMLTQRRGTNVTLPVNEQGVETTAELVQCAIQMDFCADDDSARQRAQTVELVSRSPLAATFWEPYGLTPLYADNVQDMSFVDGSEQYVQRFVATLHVSYWARLDVVVDHFTRVNLNLENVDVHHNPAQE